MRSECGANAAPIIAIGVEAYFAVLAERSLGADQCPLRGAYPRMGLAVWSTPQAVQDDP